MSLVAIKKNKTRIMVFGTFDGVHKGHLNFFKQAKKLAEKTFLIVSVARDANVKRIKGRPPFIKERQRMALVKKTKAADKVTLAGLKNHLPHILKERPDVIALGYDQRAYIKNLKKDLGKRGLSVKIVRLLPYREHIYKNALLKGKL